MSSTEGAPNPPTFDNPYAGKENMYFFYYFLQS